MTSPSWFQTSVSPLNQLGATIGYGLTPQSSSSQFDNPAYAQWLNDQATEQRRQADQQYGIQKQQLDNNYAIAVRNAKTNEERQALDQWYQQQNVQLAQARLAEEHRQFDATFGENQRQFNTTTGLNQARLGYDVLGQASQLRGPANYYQASQYARGVAGAPQTATFLSALQNNAQLPGFGAQAGLPQAESMGTLMAKLGGDASGGTSGAAPSESATLGQIGNIAAKGAGQLAPGSLEQLTPTEMGLFTSGLDKLGVDTPTFLDQYRRSRIGQSIGGNYRAA